MLACTTTNSTSLAISTLIPILVCKIFDTSPAWDSSVKNGRRTRKKKTIHHASFKIVHFTFLFWTRTSPVFIESHKTFENNISTSPELSTLSLYIFCLLYITLFRPFLCLLIPSVDRFSGEKRPAQLARRIMMAYSDRIKSTSDGAAHRWSDQALTSSYLLVLGY